MSEPLVLTKSEGPVPVITINRPAKTNAANPEVLSRLYAAWSRVATNDALSVP